MRGLISWERAPKNEGPERGVPEHSALLGLIFLSEGTLPTSVVITTYDESQNVAGGAMLANVRIARKIGLVIALLSCVMVGISALGYYSLREMIAAARQIDAYGDLVKLGARLNQHLLIMNRAEYRMAANPTEVEEAGKFLRDSAATVQTNLDRIKATAPASYRRDLDEIQRAFSAYYDSARETEAAAQRQNSRRLDQDQQSLYEIVEASRAKATPLIQQMRAVVDGIDHDGTEIANTADRLASILGFVMIGATVGGILLGAIAGLLISRRSLVEPILRIIEVLKQLAAGNVACSIEGTDRRDEIGDIARAALVFRDNARQAEELRAQQEQERQLRENRAKAIEDLTRSFDQSVGGVIDVVVSACNDMENTAQMLSGNAEQTHLQVTAVAAATEQASASVQTVASAAEELATSITEIGRQMEQSSRVSRSTAEQARETSDLVRGLVESSSRISAVVDLINDIAAQTNLLALNATIEAARAGEAGKGFAVVAGEVKHLANQTARATEEIAAQVGAVQGATNSTVHAITAIVTRIEDLNQIATAIASSVEEQSAATSEIARNVQQAAVGTQEISSTIGSVSAAANQTGGGARQVLSSSQTLLVQSNDLKQVVTDFLRKVRSA